MKQGLIKFIMVFAQGFITSWAVDRIFNLEGLAEFLVYVAIMIPIIVVDIYFIFPKISKKGDKNEKNNDKTES